MGVLFMIRRPDEWLSFVRMHVDDGVPMTHIAAKYKIRKHLQNIENSSFKNV
jgi:hypothetical protein